jgi:hypothetical protein
MRTGIYVDLTYKDLHNQKRFTVFFWDEEGNIRKAESLLSISAGQRPAYETTQPFPG